MTFPAQPFLRFALAALTWLPAAAAAQPVTVNDAWVRAPAPGQTVAAAYMELTSRVDLLLVAVASPAAAAVELHSTAMEGGVMKMRPVGRIELPAGKAVKLAPGGLHAMLVDLKQPLKTGDKVPLTLTVQRPAAASRSVFTVQAVVRDGSSEKPHHH
jgi:periplasmic copper chaperone A